MEEDVRIAGSLKNGSSLLAIASVSIQTVEFGWVTIKGFRIWKSNVFNQRLQEMINITPPAHSNYGKWTPTVFFEEPKKWVQLEDWIYSWFNSERGGKNTNSERVAEEVFLGLNNNNN